MGSGAAALAGHASCVITAPLSRCLQHHRLDSEATVEREHPAQHVEVTIAVQHAYASARRRVIERGYR